MIEEIDYATEELRGFSDWNKFLLVQGDLPQEAPRNPVTQDKDYPSLAAILLILGNSFMYMVNYYILSLAGKDYMTSLDMPVSMSGILASCTPIAVTIFGFLYSLWTNCSYRWPFIYTSVMSILGNALYFSALTYQSPAMVFIGRFCTGMGGARVIARRYMADNVSIAARTRFSVTFVAVSTLGTAMGPICGGLLTLIEPSEFCGFIVNSVTAPALAMLILWLIYLIAVLVFFKEPPIPVREQTSAKESLRCSAMLPVYYCGWNMFFGKLI